MTNVRKVPALLPALLLALGGALLFWPYTIDDTYITARYAENLAAGEGLVFNPGERVEGTSSPLFACVLALGCLLGLDPVLAAKVLGVLSFAGLVSLAFLALVRSGAGRAVASVAALWLAALPGAHVYAASGMETVPFALGVAAAVALPFLAGGRKLSRWSALAALAVLGLRPEGLALGALLLGIALVTARSSGDRVAPAVALVLLGAILLARHAYYDAWLPNTYLAKPSVLLAEARGMSLLPGAWHLASRAIASEAVTGALAAAGGIGVLCFAVLGALSRSVATSDRLPAIAALVVGALFLVYAPPDWMPRHRFALPFAFPLVLLAAIGVSRAKGRLPRAILVGAGIVWAVWNCAESLRLRAAYADERMNPALNARAFVEIGAYLRAHARPDDRLLAYEVGAVGYESGLCVVDHEGLVTRSVAQIVHEAGGYTRVRFAFDPSATRAVAGVVAARGPEWFLVRSSRTSGVVGQSLPPGSANEPIQNAILDLLGVYMRLQKTFELGAPSGIPERYHLLRRSDRGREREEDG